MEKKKLLILGSCGYLLGNFVRKLVYEKHPYFVASLDNISSHTKASNSMYWNKNHTFYVADIRDKHILDTVFQFEKPDIVLHGAEDSSNSDDFITTNILGTQNVIDSCLKYKVEKLVYLSTDKVYGSLDSESDPSWKETSPLNPNNSYAASKASAEMFIQAASNASGLAFNVIRASNSYGPRQSISKLIPVAIRSILNNEKITLYDQGLQIRDWSHVFDICSGILDVIAKGKLNEIYNISSNYELSNLEIVQKICNVIGNGHDLITFDKNKKTDFRRALDSSKIKELGWQPELNFKDGIDLGIQWYLSNQWYLR